MTSPSEGAPAPTLSELWGKFPNARKATPDETIHSLLVRLASLSEDHARLREQNRNLLNLNSTLSYAACDRDNRHDAAMNEQIARVAALSSALEEARTENERLAAERGKYVGELRAVAQHIVQEGYPGLNAADADRLAYLADLLEEPKRWLLVSPSEDDARDWFAKHRDRIAAARSLPSAPENPPPMADTMQAKDVPEQAILALIPAESPTSIGISRWDIGRAMPDVPEKVLLAKLRSMVKRGLIRGCACGCRGDFHLPSETAPNG